MIKMEQKKCDLKDNITSTVTGGSESLHFEWQLSMYRYFNSGWTNSCNITV